MKLLFCDTETTGTDPKKNGIIQLAGIVVVDGEEKESFSFDIRPMAGDIIEQKALEVSSHTKEQIEGFPPSREVYVNFCAILGRYVDKFNRQDKFHFVGYNARFDSDFIRSWFEKHGDVYYGSWFFFPPIDVMNLAALRLMERRNEMPNFKLGTIATALNLNTDGSLHDALTDIRLTRRIFDQFTKTKE